MDNDNVRKMIEAFEIIKGKGFIPSHRAGNTGIGKTLEDAIGIIENNIDAPDLHGFEIKSHRELAKSRVTLFTKRPTMPKNANALLKDNYGTPDQRFPDIKVLHTSVFHTKFNSHKSGYGFKLECSDSQKKLFLVVKNLKSNKIVSKEVYWSYPVLQSIVNKKLRNFAFVSAQTKILNGIEEFSFNRLQLYTGITLKKLLNYIKRQDGLMFDIRIGAYKSGNNYGKPHDHGSGFRIKPEQIKKLYGTEYIV